jgi:hypothetical protein
MLSTAIFHPFVTGYDLETKVSVENATITGPIVIHIEREVKASAMNILLSGRNSDSVNRKSNENRGESDLSAVCRTS